MSFKVGMSLKVLPTGMASAVRVETSSLYGSDSASEGSAGRCFVLGRLWLNIDIVSKQIVLVRDPFRGCHWVVLVFTEWNFEFQKQVYNNLAKNLAVVISTDCLVAWTSHLAFRIYCNNANFSTAPNIQRRAKLRTDLVCLFFHVLIISYKKV